MLLPSSSHRDPDGASWMLRPTRVWCHRSRGPLGPGSLACIARTDA
jgi:hypothetical protein